MGKVRLGDVVYRVKDMVDKDNTELEYYVGGEHFDSRSLTVTKKGVIKGSTIGPAFCTKFSKGDVLLMSRNPHLRKAGLIDFEGICSDVSYVIRTKNEDVLLQKFIPILFQSDIFWNFAEKNKKGSTNFFLNWSDFERFEFILPSVEEQKKLCDILWAINETEVAYDTLVNKNYDLIKAKFIDMFGEPGTDNKGWGLKNLEDCCELNPRKPKDIDDELNVSFVPMPLVSEHGEIITNNIKRYGDVKKGFTYFEDNDVLFAKITPCMENGKGCIANELENGIGLGSTEFHVLRPIKNISNSTWLYVLTIIDSFREEAQKNMTGTGGQLRVPLNFLKNYSVTLPPIELQLEYEAFVNKIMSTKPDILNAIDKLQQMYQKIVAKYIE